jgi:hypothetical protein
MQPLGRTRDRTRQIQAKVLPNPTGSKPALG